MENRPIYKTAADLGIEQWEHDGLVALIGPLSRGELAYCQGEWCGTECCIGGWIAYLNKRDQDEYVCGYEERRDLPLAKLYWGGSKSYQANHVQGARAIVNFLTLGDPRWDEVMRSDA